jgi:hypothetical protein
MADIPATATPNEDLPFNTKEVIAQAQAMGRVGWNFRISGPAATSYDYHPSVAYNSTANEYLVVWEDDRNVSTRGAEIYGQRFSASGARLGGNIRISGFTATSHEFNPFVTYNSVANQYLVVWQDKRNYSTRGDDIYGQRISSFGARLGKNFRISDYAATSDDHDPAVAYNPTTNQYLVVWHDYRNDSTRGIDIYGQRVSASGAHLGSKIRISGSTAKGDETDPFVAYNSVTNQYLVVWADNRNVTKRSLDIYGQRLKAYGALQGNNFRISGPAANGKESYPTVAYNSVANQYLVVWQDKRNYSTRGKDIYSQRIRASGTLLGNKFRISGSAATSNEYEPSVVYNSAANQYLVVWSDGRNVPSYRGDDIYGQRWAP